MRKKTKILLVGQTPPPYGGQAIMIEKILSFQYDDIDFFHVRMNFSTEMDSIGKFQIKKLFELIRVIFFIYKYRFFYNVRIIYYPPAGPNFTPILRDIFILWTTRFLFKKTIYHFHAGGISEKYKDLPKIFKWAFKKAYHYPDLSIRLSKLNPEDGKFLLSKRDIIVPYGIDDVAEKFELKDVKNGRVVKILFTGVLKESKGVSVLLKAISLVLARGYKNISVSIMGKFESIEYETEVRALIEENNMDNYVHLLGVKTGMEKFSIFNDCDIFCFPSFFESETFGIVLLEAMQFSKPIIATNWRGIPDIIQNNTNGFLIEPRNEVELSQALVRLIDDESLRIKFGENSRRIYKERYTSEIFKQVLHRAFRNCIE